MNIKVQKGLKAKTKATLILVGVLAVVIVMIMIPYFVNVLDSSKPKPAYEVKMTEDEIEEVDEDTDDETENETSGAETEETAAVEADYVETPMTAQPSQSAETNQVVQPAQSAEPAPASTPAPEPAPTPEPAQRGVNIDNRGVDDDGYTATGIDDNGDTNSMYTNPDEN